MATDTKKIELNQTNNALAELSEVLLKLNEVIDSKKDVLVQERKKRELENIENSKRTDILAQTSKNIINNIDTVISKLDKILENDGTSNNND